MFESIILGDTYNKIVLLQLVIALVFGFIIGLEREVRRKPIGIRTCTVISVVSCLLTIMSIEATNSLASSVKPMDPLRIPAQIVSGIGFIGAGVILRRSKNVVSGLTTAAIIWGVSGVGIAIGAGYTIQALTAVILIFIGVEIFPFVFKRFGLFNMNEKKYSINIETYEKQHLDTLLEKIKEQNISIHGIKIEDREKFVILKIKTYVKHHQDVEVIYKNLKAISSVDKISLE